MKLTTASFRGMAPRISDRLLPPEASAQAINARLLNGSLTPWKRPLYGETFSNAGQVRTIFKLDDTWLSFEEEVECARGTILGDTDFRTYITGLDVPRFTTKELAVTHTGATPPYPFETRPLGVPGPDDVPQLALSVDPGTEGGITIINPGAEDGDDTGWTQTTPDLTVYENGDIPGINAQSGTFWFYGGTGSSGEYYQSFTADSVGVAVGQNLTLSWFQATGSAGSQAQLGLRFFDSGVNVVGEQFAEMTAPSPANTWVQRSVTFQVPADTVTFRIVIKFLNVGGGVTDAYIDTIALRVESVDYFSDGTDLSTWTLGPQSTRDNAYRTTVQQDIGGTHGSVFVWRSDRATGYIYRTLGYSDAASFRVEWSGNLNYSDANFQCAIGANGGVGDIISVRQQRVSKGSISSYDGSGSGFSTLAELSGSSNLGSNWFRVVITGARSGTNQFSVSVTVTNLTTGLIVCDAASTTMTATGDQLIFRYYSGGDNSGQRGYLDDILSSIVPNAPNNTAETTLTSYVYRYVNDFGEASVPSLPSRIIQRASSGVTVTVTTDTVTPTGYDDYFITYKQIYRAATGSAGTVYRFVAEIPLAQADYVDVLDDDELGEVLDSEDWDLPPDDLRYILALPNGIMCGASGNQLCFSVQNRPHAWPVGFRLPTDTDITGLGNIDNAVIVGTKSFVYTASGNSPESYSMSKPGAPHACQSARSFAYLLRVGCVFAGPDGLMAVNGPTEVQNLTEGIFTREQWQALDPSTITAVSHDDMYFWFYGTTATGSTDPAGYMLDTRQSGNGLIKLSYHASAAAVDIETDSLYFVLDSFEDPCNPTNATGGSTEAQPVLLMHWDGDFVDATGNTIFTPEGSGYSFEASDDPAFDQQVVGSNSNPRAFGTSFIDMAIGTNVWQIEGISTFETGDIGGIVAAKNYWATDPGGTFFKDDWSVGISPTALTMSWTGVVGEYSASITTTTGVPFRWAISDDGTTMRFYIDGTLIHTETSASLDAVPPPVTPGSSITVLNKLEGFNSGNPNWSGSFLRGKLDELRMFIGDVLYTGSSYVVATEPFSPAPVELYGGTVLYRFNAGTPLCYEWNSKLFLLPYPMALQWCRVRALDYTDVTIRFYADDVLLHTKVVTNNRAFRIPVRSDYSRMTYMLEGTSEVYSVQISDDVEELE